MSARVVKVIITDLERRGDGKSDPFRVVTQIWTLDGELICEADPVTDKNCNRAMVKLLLGDFE